VPSSSAARTTPGRLELVSSSNGAWPTPERARTFTVLIVVPTLHAGAADVGAIELVCILRSAGHRAIVLSQGGRLQNQVTKAGGEFVYAAVASKNPFVMLRNAIAIARLVRRERCDIVHALGRAPGWSAFLAARIARVPFLTSWHKGFRDQNPFKHVYNSVMAKGDRVIAVSDQIAELVFERYRIPWERIAVIPASIDFTHFDPGAVAPECIDAMRRQWGVPRDAKIVLVVGRMLRRKGHHLVVRAMQRLKEMGVKDFACVFVGEDQGRSRYTGEVWDLVLATNTADIVRMTGPVDDMRAAYAAATVVVSAATQPEGLQRAILEAQAMARPVIVSDLGAGPEAVLAPPAVPEDRMTGLRFTAGDESALTAAFVRLFSLAPAAQRAIGLRGREWVISHFDAESVTESTLNLYADALRGRGNR
jgi:glycosyltransferase involved in cell wall biosynthesis